MGLIWGYEKKIRNFSHVRDNVAINTINDKAKKVPETLTPFSDVKYRVNS
jgi:hypothetical protein